MKRRVFGSTAKMLQMSLYEVESSGCYTKESCVRQSISMGMLAACGYQCGYVVAKSAFLVLWLFVGFVCFTTALN